MSLSFLDFPGEVRNKIYRLILVHHPLHLAHYKPKRASGGPIRYHGWLWDNRMRHGRYAAYFEPVFDLSILRTCRIIYKEAMSILYGENVLWFDCLPLGSQVIDFKLSQSKLSYKGIRLQRKLIGLWNSMLRILTPKSCHIPLRCSRDDGFGRVQHVGLTMRYDNHSIDQYGKIPNCSRSMAAALRNFTQSGFSSQTAKLEIKFDNYCEPDDFALDSVLMRAALGLLVEREIIITATGFVDESIGEFASALAKRKGWGVERKETYHAVHYESDDEDSNDAETLVITQANGNTEDDEVELNEQSNTTESEDQDTASSDEENDEFGSPKIHVISWRMRPRITHS